jgi:alkanesulfonate monooxygenase SsuD/methylene tetrahydromethanopterin reductase-like flavin-dependent oxidoreductase (luciferase family)
MTVQSAARGLAAAAPSTPTRIKLGFNSRVAFPSGPGNAERGLRDGIELFRAAEQLGYDSGWVYQRHFDNYLANPLTFLTAVGQHTSRIRLGTAIIAMRYEDPLLLAEAAATADLLTGRRLELAIGTGQGNFDALFGRDPANGRTDSRQRLARFLSAIRGEVLGVVDRADQGAPVGTELRISPQSETLIDRIWYGAGSIESSGRTASQGLNMLLGTIIQDTVPGTVGDYHAEAIAEYRRTYTGSNPRVGVSRSVLPATNSELAALYRDYDIQRQTQGPAAARPDGALAPTTLPAGMTVVPALRGTPSQVVDMLAADASVAASDELVLFLPPSFTLSQNIRLLEDVAQTVAPHIGWSPQTNSDDPLSTEQESAS